jgi:competence protein ComEC
MNLILVVIAWILGVVLAEWLQISPQWGWPLVGAGSGALILVWLTRQRVAMSRMALMLGIVCYGMVRLILAQPNPPTHAIVHLAGQTVQVRGWIANDPKRTERGQQILLVAEAYRTTAGWRRTEGLVVVKLPALPEYQYGQRLFLEGDLAQPRAGERPGDFDYQSYLRRKGILVTMDLPLARALPGETGNPIVRTLLRFREACRTTLMRLLPEPQAAIAIGILLGLQASIPNAIYETFSITGTSHILVVSGWNFTMVAGILASLTTRLRLGKGATLILSLIALWSYAIFVGATGTVLRAAVMASLVVIAQASDRQGMAWYLLAGACWLLSIADPYVLWDLGFQLSALATASLFAYGKPTQELLERIPLLRHPWLSWMTEALTATLAAQILALPIILFHFGNLSLIAPFANIVIVPFVPYAMLLGMLALVAGLIWLPLGQSLALLLWIPITWMTTAAAWLARIPWAAVQIPPFPLWMLIGYYAIVVGGWWWMRGMHEVFGE